MKSVRNLLAPNQNPVLRFRTGKMSKTIQPSKKLKLSQTLNFFYKIYIFFSRDILTRYGLDKKG